LTHDLEGSRFSEVLPFVRGGFWRHFLVKYAEVNTLHRLALRAGAKIHAMAPGREQTRALEELWAGEGNCPYWHGVFGGVYLPHIRGAAFSHLIAAEALADAAARDPGPYALGEAADLDGDGHTEVRLATDVFALAVDPGRGGSLVEWDCRRTPTRGSSTSRPGARPCTCAGKPRSATAGSRWSGPSKRGRVRTASGTPSGCGGRAPLRSGRSWPRSGRWACLAHRKTSGL